MTTWTRVLKATGMLTRTQSDQIDAGAWVTALNSGQWILYREAVWDPEQFQRGGQIAHRVLITSIYLALNQQMAEWEREVTRGEVTADARFQLIKSPWRYWLEADTGKETKRQWLAKLDRYRTTFWDEDDILLVVAAGRATRLGRLATWIEEAALPLGWILLGAEAWESPNDLDPSEWALHSPRPLSTPPIAPHHVEYSVENHGPIPAQEVSRWTQQGYQLSYTKIVAGGELRVLTRQHSRFFKHVPRKPTKR